jgi:MFS family permease
VTDGKPPAMPTNTDSRYKWIALSNTTIGMLIAVINGSIVVIALPAIFRGLHLDPLTPGNVSYLLWMLMGFLLVTAVLVVTFGRLGDIYGRTKVYNLGFVVFTIGALASALVPNHGSAGAIELIICRVVTGVGGAMLMANSTALLTDAFPVSQRGLALGINQIAGIAGSFIGLVLGGVLADWNWRAVFWVSVPIGIIGTIWGYTSLHDVKGSGSEGEHLDWAGTITFGVGLIAILVGITYGIQPYGGHTQGWLNPWVLTALIGGVIMLGIFAWVEKRVEQPMFDEKLFGIKAFTFGNIASLLAAIARGGLQFMLIIWLQGIWLPLHGYNYADTPLWAGIYLLPLSVGFLLAGPVSGYLSDHFGARLFATGGLLITAATFIGLLLLPTDFNYVAFAALLVVNGIGFGLFAAPNTTGIMNAVPAKERGVASGMRATFMNAGNVLSIGIFFSLMIAGLASTLPNTLDRGLQQNGVPAAAARRVASEPPVGSLFSAFLGYNPIQKLVGEEQLSKVTPQQQATLTGKKFFPDLIAKPFKHGLSIVFISAAIMSVVAALASQLRGGKYVHEEDEGMFAGEEPIAAPDTGQHRAIKPGISPQT